VCKKIGISRREGGISQEPFHRGGRSYGKSLPWGYGYFLELNIVKNVQYFRQPRPMTK